MNKKVLLLCESFPLPWNFTTSTSITSRFVQYIFIYFSGVYYLPLVVFFLNIFFSVYPSILVGV
jgi:hypothetical protein